jgi:hypothetical protein
VTLAITIRDGQQEIVTKWCQPMFSPSSIFLISRKWWILDENPHFTKKILLKLNRDFFQIFLFFSHKKITK